MFANSLDFPACQKMFLCCAISASREMTMTMPLKRKRAVLLVCFYLRRLKGTLLAAANTLTSTHVPEEVSLWGILAGEKLIKPKTILSS